MFANWCMFFFFLLPSYFSQYLSKFICHKGRLKRMKKIALSDNSLCIQQHLAASRGYEDTTLFLIQEGVDINIKGNLLILVINWL